MKEVVIGIDIGGTFTKYGIVDREGNTYFEGSTSTENFDNVNSYLKNLHLELEKAIAEARKKEELNILGIGIGSPNGNYYKGTVEHAPNLKWKGIVHLADRFREYYNLPIKLTNDANAAALGEMIYGGAKNMKDFIVVTLGTGLGSGIVVNGNVVYGHDGFAGELGHVTVKPNGRRCGCGRRGCLETYVSATGIRRTLFKLMGATTFESELRNYTFEQVDSRMIYEYAKKGDPLALEAFDNTARTLGLKLADAVAITSPEAIFLFGGLTRAGEFIFDPTKKYMEENMLEIFKNKVKLLPSALTDKNAAVLGASALIWKELLLADQL